ncbi:gluconate 2-dehydrogenase subunit 3 family protein [Halorarum halobium]|uniref:gluconate 2-dehydrogenase subunit 3 family protein n=1 Tax=Halorarum halobium TaxID=3075121 RepID=UPI0028A969DB|nr:gluconate 2-dehydrogenase subunit 3 family protein [Halobaculum sp. XH14]
MQLSRRDALAALAAGGAAVAGGCAGLEWGDGEATEGRFTPAEREALVAVARTVYPSTVSGVPEFVETYCVGRVRDRPNHREGVADAVETLDEYAEAWRDARFADLDPAARDAHLREMAVDTADPVPDGDDPERVRHFLVNELLYALYTTPTGGELVGIENPQGFPGGTVSYRQPPTNGDAAADTGGGTDDTTGSDPGTRTPAGTDDA